MFKNDKKLKPVLFDIQPPSNKKIREEAEKYKKPSKPVQKTEKKEAAVESVWDKDEDELRITLLN